MDDGDLTIRVGNAGDWDAVADLMDQLFHHAEAQDLRAIEGATYEPERALIAEEAGVVAGHACAYTRDLTVPGSIVPAAHISQVGVAPTHRRRGLLTRLMRRQLEEIAAASREPIAVLWASEGAIYPRFGYGFAASRVRMEINTAEVRLKHAPTPAGRLRMVSPVTGNLEFAKIFEQLRPENVGWSSRDDRWWAYATADVESERDGATQLRGVICETDGVPSGYALWRTLDGWGLRGPRSEVHVIEWAATDPRAYATLWEFLLGLDLVRVARVWMAALDEPLQYLVNDPKRLGMDVADALWIRVVDVPAALSARRYSAPANLVLELTDPVLAANTGRFRLTIADDGTATCTPTTDPADLSCGIVELGAVYLGAVSWSILAAGGSVRELTPGALRSATTSFRWHRMPQFTEIF
jgi:predicted acetyltransferase